MIFELHLLLIQIKITRFDIKYLIDEDRKIKSFYDFLQVLNQLISFHCSRFFFNRIEQNIFVVINVFDSECRSKRMRNVLKVWLPERIWGFSFFYLPDFAYSISECLVLCLNCRFRVPNKSIRILTVDHCFMSTIFVSSIW